MKRIYPIGDGEIILNSDNSGDMFIGLKAQEVLHMFNRSNINTWTDRCKVLNASYKADGLYHKIKREV